MFEKPYPDKVAIFSAASFAVPRLVYFLEAVARTDRARLLERENARELLASINGRIDQ
jgi:hypothetical protein